MAAATKPVGTLSDAAAPPSIEWRNNSQIPLPCAAVMDALKFTSVSVASLFSLQEEEWQQALRFCDESRLTLLLGHAFGRELPPAVANRIQRNHAANAIRFENLKREYRQIAQRLDASSIDHVVLKGFSQEGWFVSDLSLRPQYDLDLWCPPEHIARAQRALADLGFVSIHEQERFPTDHLPPMVRKTGWDWRDDYFDVDMPPVVELHLRLWDEATERFGAPGLEEFWSRRERRPFGETTIPTLHPADQLAFAALHLLRHLLRGDVKAVHAYEIAYFLHGRRHCAEFWDEWRDLHPAKLRRMQTIAFCLARKWFGCELPPAVAEEIRTLPAEIHGWFESYGACAIESRFRASKDELWLHLALLSSLPDRLAVIRRRLIPLTLPGGVESRFVSYEQRTPGHRLRTAIRYGLSMGSRAFYHLRSLGSVVVGGIRWWRLRRALRSGARVLARPSG